MPSFTVRCEKGKANTIVCEVIPRSTSAKASVSVRQAGVSKTARRSGRGKVTVRLKAAERLRGKERVVVRYRSSAMQARVVLRLGKTVKFSAKR
jgi:hypothetical protein